MTTELKPKKRRGIRKLKWACADVGRAKYHGRAPVKNEPKHPLVPGNPGSEVEDQERSRLRSDAGQQERRQQQEQME